MIASLRRARLGRPALVVVLLAGVLALLVSFRPSLHPLGLHNRVAELGYAKTAVLMDTPTSALLDANQDIFGPPERAFTYAMFLQTDAARAAIERGAGVPSGGLATSGPFTELINRPNIVRKHAVPGPPAPQTRSYRLVLDIVGTRPVLTIYAQAPTEAAAVALVRSTVAVMQSNIAQRLRAFDSPEPARTILRPLGPVESGSLNGDTRLQLTLFVFLLGLVAGGSVVYRRRVPPRSDEPRLRPLAEAVGAPDDWPHTTRILPWALAGFLAMIFLVPFDQISLPIPMPMDGKLDRPVLGALTLLWIAALLGARGAAKPRVKVTRVHIAALVFFSICSLSAVFNAAALLNLDEFSLVVKKLALLASFIIFFFIVVSVVRPSEVPKFATLLLGLAAVAALGAIWEYRMRFNPFYEWSSKLMPGTVGFPGDMYGRDIIGRLTVYGPTGHPLELATMLGVITPFALVGFMAATERRRRYLFAVALALCLCGALVTSRKTSVIAPVAGIVLVLAYRPRMIRKLIPLGITMAILVHGIAPGTIGTMIFQLSPSNFGAVRSTQDRTSDYDGIRPDVVKHLVLGRGFQSYDGYKYRILDNQILGLVIGVGLLGLVAYLWIGAAILSCTHRMIRGPDVLRARYALASAASVGVVGVASLLFDTLSFPHVPYLMFFIAGLVVVLREPAAAASGDAPVERAPHVHRLQPADVRVATPATAMHAGD
jgi:hypothetical protein